MRAKADAQPDGLCTNYEQPSTCVTHGETGEGQDTALGELARPKSDDRSASPGPEPELLTVGDVAHMLSFGERTIFRMADTGRIPQPFRIGGAVRWSRRALIAWVADGCPAVRALPRPR